MGTNAMLMLAGSLTLGQVEFIRGDANRDSRLELADAVFTLGYAFLGSHPPSCLDAADADDDGAITIGDAVATLSYLFLGRLPPPAPFPNPGQDPTVDRLGCHESSLALQFARDPAIEGSRQHVDIFPSSSLDFSHGFSFTAWVLIDEFQAVGMIFRKTLTNGQHLEVSLRDVDEQGRPRLRFIALPHVPVTPRFLSRAVLPVGQWVHVACTFGEGYARMYVNGVADSSVAVPHNEITSSHVGAYLGSSNDAPGFVGRVDEITLWNRSIGQEELAACRIGLRGSEAGLVAYFKCDEGQGPNVLDLSANGNHGRLGLTAAADVDDPAWVTGKQHPE